MTLKTIKIKRYKQFINESNEDSSILEPLRNDKGELKFLKRVGKYRLKYKGYNFLIISKRYYQNQISTFEIYLLKEGATKDYYDFNIMFEPNLEEKDNEDQEELFKYELDSHIESHENMIELEKDRKEKLKKGYKDICPFTMKQILLEVIPGYIGNTHQALSGSEYIMIGGNEIRVSDHERSPYSKWNFIHGDYNNILSGLLNIERVKKYIEHLIDGEMTKEEYNKLQEIFK